MLGKVKAMCFKTTTYNFPGLSMTSGKLGKLDSARFPGPKMAGKVVSRSRVKF